MDEVRPWSFGCVVERGVQGGSGEARCRLGYGTDGEEVNIGQPAGAKKNTGVNSLTEAFRSSSLHAFCGLDRLDQAPCQKE